MNTPSIIPLNARNLVLVISSLRMGGAEKVISLLAGHFAARGVRVRLVTFAPASQAPFHALDPRVERVGLGLEAPSSGALQGAVRNFARIRALRRLLREDRPDAVISFIDKTNVRALLAAAGLGLPVVVSERTYPFPGALSRPWRLLRRLLYPRAAALVVPARACAEAFPYIAGKIRAIPNPVPVPPAALSADAVPTALSAPTRRPEIVAVGRLIPRKGFDVLVRAFARIAADAPAWTLRILGSGPEKENLRDLIRAEGLAHRISLEPAVSDPSEILRRAAIFALPSRFEGFPNVLCEAMACGCAVAASDCPTGPGEIVTNNKDGILVPPGDSPALAEALRALIAEPGLRAAMGARAEAAMERYAPARVLAQWEALVEEIVEEQREALVSRGRA